MVVGAASTPFADPPSMDWVSLTPTPPVALAGAGFAALASDGSGVLFGGNASTGLSDATYLYNETENTWSDLSPPSAPSNRSDFGISTDSAAGTAVLFGGEVNVATHAASNATWVFDFATNRWTNVSTSVAPAARQDPAFAVGNGVALLYGGWNQNSSGSGEFTYADTWLLDLTTDAWSRVTPPGGISPGALHGASLVWQPTENEFLLFGGCYPCSSAIWSFSLTTDAWSRITPSGPSPAPRMDAVWTWDPSQGVDLLFGGTNGTVALSSPYFYNPATSAWSVSSSPQAPSARYSAAADFLAVPGNATLLLTGGTNGLFALSDAWRFSAVANLTVRVVGSSTGSPIANASVTVNSGAPLTTNSTGYVQAEDLPAWLTSVAVQQAGYANRTALVWLPPGATVTAVESMTELAPANVTVTVTDPALAPIEGALVSLTYGTALLPPSPVHTNDEGNANFVDVPAATYFVGVSLHGYHSVNLSRYIAPGVDNLIGITISPLFVLTVHAVGVLPNTTRTNLSGASISLGREYLGTTGANGSLTATPSLSGNQTVHASVYGFLNASAPVEINFTGSATVNLSLNSRPFPSVTIEILGQRGNGPGNPVQGANVTLTNTTPIATGPFSETLSTNVDGNVVFVPPPGNYSIEVSAAGYLTNDSIPVLDASPDASLGRTIYIELIPFSTIHVLVLSAGPGNPPVGGAKLLLRFSGVNVSDGLPFPPIEGSSLPTGWANISGVPSGTTYWSSNATGFLPANGTFSVVYGHVPNQFTIYLPPIPPARYTGLEILPLGTSEIWSLILLPIAGVIGALVYLTMLRNPSSREREIRENAAATRGGLRRPGQR